MTTEHLPDGWTPCRSGEHRPDLWFGTGSAAAQAKALCEACPIIAECRELGWEHTEGVFGGLSGPDRYRMDPERWNATRARTDREQTAMDKAIKLARGEEAPVAGLTVTSKRAAEQARYRAAHPERVREAAEKQREAQRQRAAKWREANRDKHNETCRRYRAERREAERYVNRALDSKECRTCHRMVELSGYAEDRRRADGRRGSCRDCTSAANRAARLRKLEGEAA